MGVPIKAVETNRKLHEVQLSGIAGNHFGSFLGWIVSTLPRFNVLTLQRSKVSTLQRSNVLTVAALAFLWWRLIDHLRVEWSINPQYTYGWAVPFLCLFLAWRRMQRPQSCEALLPGTNQPALPTSNTFPVSRFTSYVSCFTFQAFRIAQPRRLALAGFLLLAALWLPIRLIQEANPEWRLVSWALAIDVIGLSLLLPHRLRAKQLVLPGSSDLIFPLCFMLLAVPWPSVFEQSLVQRLSRSTASLTSEALNLIGIPAVQQGNLVEVRAGVVGIEEACCGIRSFQAALMLAMFFGECYRLNTLHRLGLVLAGGFLAYGSNIARTSLLAAIVARQGMTNVGTWHNTVGLFSSLACFATLALLARAIVRLNFGARKSRPAQIPTDSSTKAHESASLSEHSRFKNYLQLFNCETPGLRKTPENSFLNFRVFRVFRGTAAVLDWSGVGLAAWLLLAEALTETWYRAHETRLPAPLTWAIAVPPKETDLEEKPLSSKTKQLLRFDSGQDITWKDAAGWKWQAIFLYWAPGRVAARLAKDHTPAICLSAAGRSLLAHTKEDIAVSGLRMQADRYVATDDRLGKVHVLYCIREDRSCDDINSIPRSIWQERLAPVLAGRRNSGQRSLELAVWGIDDETEARRELIEQMQRIVHLRNARNTRSNPSPARGT